MQNATLVFYARFPKIAIVAKLSCWQEDLEQIMLDIRGRKYNAVLPDGSSIPISIMTKSQVNAKQGLMNRCADTEQFW